MKLMHLIESHFYIVHAIVNEVRSEYLPSPKHAVYHLHEFIGDLVQFVHFCSNHILSQAFLLFVKVIVSAKHHRGEDVFGRRVVLIEEKRPLHLALYHEIVQVLKLLFPDVNELEDIDDLLSLEQHLLASYKDLHGVFNTDIKYL